MTGGGPVARIAAVLEEAGYEAMKQPEVAGIPFDFAATLAARGSLDLVVVADLVIEADEARLRRGVEALARALDLVRSRRSLTVVLVGPAPGAHLIQALALVGRVLRVRPEEDDGDSLHDALSVLLPLRMDVGDFDPERTSDRGWAEERQRLLDSNPIEIGPLLEIASRGADAVGATAARIIGDPIEDFYRAEDDGVPE
jgi:hypothetical protein